MVKPVDARVAAERVGVDVTLKDGMVVSLSPGLYGWAMEVGALLAQLDDNTRAAVGKVMATTENGLVAKEHERLQAVIQAAKSGSGTDG